ncbi:transcriptional regulator MraZ [Betaproteobacteria bacterium]|nr:transcriptional regulator MraZ [Betaproteobacteria bacterium]
MLSLDAKGRLAIPARHREELASASDGQLVLTVHQHRCLLLYPLHAWEPIRDKLNARATLNVREAVYQQRNMVGMAKENLALDSSGRLLIPPELRQFAQIEKLLWLVGLGSHFEIWSDAGWQRQQNIFLEMGDQPLPPGLEDLVL